MNSKRRTWLADQYPKGVGMGDLVREYFIYAYEKENNKENVQRRSEIVATLDFMFKLNSTPTFSEKFGSIYV